MSTSEHYLQFKILPPAVGPVRVVRDDGCTLLIIDPRCRKIDAMMGCADLLEPDEIDVFRAAFGGPPQGQPCPESWVSEDLVDTTVPIDLYLPTQLPAINTARFLRQRTAEMRNEAVHIQVQRSHR